MWKSQFFTKIKNPKLFNYSSQFSENSNDQFPGNGCGYSINPKKLQENSNKDYLDSFSKDSAESLKKLSSDFKENSLKRFENANNKLLKKLVGNTPHRAAVIGVHEDRVILLVSSHGFRHLNSFNNNQHLQKFDYIGFDIYKDKPRYYYILVLTNHQFANLIDTIPLTSSMNDDELLAAPLGILSVLAKSPQFVLGGYGLSDFVFSTYLINPYRLLLANNNLFNYKFHNIIRDNIINELQNLTSILSLVEIKNCQVPFVAGIQINSTKYISNGKLVVIDQYNNQNININVPHPSEYERFPKLVSRAYSYNEEDGSIKCIKHGDLLDNDNYLGWNE